MSNESGICMSISMYDEYFKLKVTSALQRTPRRTYTTLLGVLQKVPSFACLSVVYDWVMCLNI